MKKQKIYNWEQLPLVLNVQQVAIILGVSDATVRTMVKRGQLIPIQQYSKKQFFYRETVKNFIEIA